MYILYSFNIYYIFDASFTNSSGYCKHKFIMFVLTHGQLPTSSGLGKIGDAEEQVAGLQQMLVEKKSGSLCDVKVMWVAFSTIWWCVQLQMINSYIIHILLVTTVHFTHGEFQWFFIRHAVSWKRFLVQRSCPFPGLCWRKHKRRWARWWSGSPSFTITWILTACPWKSIVRKMTCHFGMA